MSTPSTLPTAKAVWAERHARVLAVFASDPTRAWTAEDVASELRHRATRTEVKSALYALAKKGRIELAVRGYSGKESSYRLRKEGAATNGLTNTG